MTSADSAVTDHRRADRLRSAIPGPMKAAQTCLRLKCGVEVQSGPKRGSGVSNRTCYGSDSFVSHRASRSAGGTPTVDDRATTLHGVTTVESANPRSDAIGQYDRVDGQVSSLLVRGERARVSEPRRVIVADMAGTTIRDPGVVERAVGRVIESINGEVSGASKEVLRNSRGASKIDMFRALVGENRAATAHRQFQQLVLNDVENEELSAMPGATQALAGLRDSGCAIALVTGFSQEICDALIQRLGWSGLVDLVLSSDDVSRGRPHPDLPLTAFLRLQGRDVADIAVVGDTANDLIAGTRSGAGIVAGVLTGAHDRDRLLAAPHTHLLADITEFAELAAASERGACSE